MQHDQELESRLNDLFRRVEALEARQPGSHSPVAPAPAAIPSLAACRPNANRPKPEIDEAAESARAAALQRLTDQSNARPSTPPPASAATTSTHASAMNVSDLERLVGIKVFAVAGALIVIAGAAFFFKLAWDQGWLGRLPNEWKAISGALSGFALLICGDVVRRRFGTVAGTGLNAAGLGVLYATAYASHPTLQLVNRPTALALLALSSIIGFVVAARSRSVAIACISMVGAYGAPFLLSTGDPPPLGFLPAYWIAVMATGVGLAAARGSVFAPARALGWWFTLILGLGWTAWRGADHPLVGATFFAAFWTMTHMELLLRAKYERLDDRNAPLLALDPRLASWRGVLTSLTTTAWAVGLAAAALHASAHAHLDWLAPATGFAVTAPLALIQVGSLRVLRDQPRNNIERLGAGFAASAGALAVLTIAMALVSWTQVASWFALALAAALGARWMRARSLSVYAVIVAAIGTARLCALQWWSQPAIVSSNGFVLSQISILVIAGGFVWVALAALCKLGRQREDASLRDLCLAIGFGMLIAAPAHQDATAQALLASWLVLSVVVWMAGFMWTAPALHRFAYVGSCFAIVAWIGADLHSEWLRSQGQLILNVPMIAAMSIGALGFAIAARERRYSTMSHQQPWLIPMIALPALWMFGVTTMEVMRIAERVFSDATAQRAVVSFWWAAIALGLLVSGVAIRNPAARRVGLAVLAVAGAKTALYGLVGIGAAWRVGTFLGVGGVMLLVAVFYARASRLSMTTRAT